MNLEQKFCLASRCFKGFAHINHCLFNDVCCASLDRRIFCDSDRTFFFHFVFAVDCENFSFSATNCFDEAVFFCMAYVFVEESFYARINRKIIVDKIFCLTAAYFQIFCQRERAHSVHEAKIERFRASSHFRRNIIH